MPIFYTGNYKTLQRKNKKYLNKREDVQYLQGGKSTIVKMSEFPTVIHTQFNIIQSTIPKDFKNNRNR